MPFVNEHISKEDFQKFDLAEVDRRYVVGGKQSRSWTRDKARNIYLRCVAEGREDAAHRSIWTLYWEGALLEIHIDVLKTSRNESEAMWSHKRVRKMVIPPDLESRRIEIVDVLKEAFLAYKDGGVFAKAASYSLTLEV